MIRKSFIMLTVTLIIILSCGQDAGDKSAVEPIILKPEAGKTVFEVLLADHEVDYSQSGMGVFINKGVAARCAEDCRKRIIGRLHEVVGEAKAAGMQAKDIEKVCETSFALDTNPYDDVPKEVLALAKKR